MQQRISSQEFTEYLAYFSVEPWPEEREDINSALIASVIANTARDTKTKPQPFSINDFKIDYWKEPAAPLQQSVERMKAEMALIAKIAEKTQGNLNG